MRGLVLKMLILSKMDKETGTHSDIIPAGITKAGKITKTSLF